MPRKPSPARVGQEGRRSGEHSASGSEPGIRLQERRPRGLTTVEMTRRAVDPEVRTIDAGERERVSLAGRRRRRPRRRRRTLAALGAPRPRAGWTASGRRAIAPIAASTGPAMKRSPARASRQQSASQTTASAAYATAAAWATFPSGKTGTNSAIASPRRGERSVAAPRRRARRIMRPGVQNGSSVAPMHDRHGGEAGRDEPLFERERSAERPSAAPRPCAGAPGSSGRGGARRRPRGDRPASRSADGRRPGRP